MSSSRLRLFGFDEGLTCALGWDGRVDRADAGGDDSLLYCSPLSFGAKVAVGRRRPSPKALFGAFSTSRNAAAPRALRSRVVGGGRLVAGSPLPARARPSAAPSASGFSHDEHVATPNAA